MTLYLSEEFISSLNKLYPDFQQIFSESIQEVTSYKQKTSESPAKIYAVDQNEKFSLEVLFLDHKQQVSDKYLTFAKVPRYGIDITSNPTFVMNHINTDIEVFKLHGRYIEELQFQTDREAKYGKEAE